MPRNEQRWLLYLSHAVEVLQETGEVPRGEHHPGGWVQQQRSATRRGDPAMTTTRASLLDAHLPGWREALPQRDWFETAEAARAHHAAVGSLPSQKAPTPEQRRLGRWVTIQRSQLHCGTLSDERRKWLDTNLPGWQGRGPRTEAWTRTAAELGVWVAASERWPGPRADDVEERRLGYWLKNRRDDLRDGRMDAARQALLDDVAPGWRGRQ